MLQAQIIFELVFILALILIVVNKIYFYYSVFGKQYIAYKLHVITYTILLYITITLMYTMSVRQLISIYRYNYKWIFTKYYVNEFTEVFYL